ncbi:hypothetical protein BGX29_003315 [Mortierella sp. GBA35]|nr:hypothetical protein BGX29_003315 [Mortierella sp. GBA35]
MASGATGSSNNGIPRYAASQHPHRGALHRLAMSKGLVSAYDTAQATDQTVDGITCSSGEDLVMLLKVLRSWIQQTSEQELEDVILIILNLNELGNNSQGSRPTPPTPNPTPASPPVTGVTPPAPPPISNSQFFEQIVSPNTNRTIMEVSGNMVSLRQLFLDEFPSLMYSPNHLELDRANLEASWWRDGPVGLDYYNTSTNPTTKKTEAPTGWPTSLYLRKVIKRRIVVGIGANNLALNTTYNITADYTTFHPQGVMGPSMTNSSLLRVSSTLNLDSCSLPVPGVMMYPTGSEENFTQLEALRRDNGPITNNVTWSYSSMSDNDMSPWDYFSGKLATNCGFSPLVEGRSQLLSYSEQTAMTIWSWESDHPPEADMRSRNRRCGAMNKYGRWVVQDCNAKLPVACRKTGTSSEWIIYERGASSYRDVTCPEGYKFDVPRTGRENQMLFSTLSAYRNLTTTTFFQSLSIRQTGKFASSLRPVPSQLSDPALANKHNMKRNDRVERRHPRSDDNSDDEDDDDNDEEENDSRNNRKAQSPSDEQQHHSGVNMATRIRKETIEQATPTPVATNGDDQIGIIWIDISSWQTAGCWVPGGIDGICPYRAPDNTAALQEIIKVSIIGGVIILVLVGVFLYIKCRRNVRLRKASKRRADVRTKILLTEVETVPA